MPESTLDSRERRGKIALAALLLSLFVHAAVLGVVGPLPVRGRMVLASQVKEMSRTFHLRRAELPSSLFQARAQSSTPTTAPVPDLEVPKEVKGEEAIVQKLAQQNPVRVPLSDTIPGGAPEVAVLAPTPPSETSPYAPDLQAEVENATSRTNVGPAVLGTPSDAIVLPSGIGPDPRSGASAAGQAGTHPEEAAGGEGLPGADEIQSQFRAAGNFDPRIPQPIMVRLPSDILFDFDSYQLRPDAEPLLVQVADILKRFGRADVEIGGHTDTFGDDQYNQRLSQLRAEAVQRWFEQRLPGDHLSFHATGYGRSKPIVNPRGSIEEQAKNRRVEIVIRALSQ
ncbi:Outer membrane protein or related peptidoglycan-associated (Lipo)protein [Methylacidimicrobium sp. AP8]|uniref:OmpA family protein n=1 Tax=Methylacidimicrobium sp. AP8 TaxID=2730359 RepID=UPI0018C0141A|nr:OmpA family protein [Methylacidimicrobium sp. AP8]CAB4243076.1 Outer membrane protein or related peptidoglycan-associated (Lipo)protein [Methylacidimicrobium sp. AP8]